MKLTISDKRLKNYFSKSSNIHYKVKAEGIENKKWYIDQPLTMDLQYNTKTVVLEIDSSQSIVINLDDYQNCEKVNVAIKNNPIYLALGALFLIYLASDLVFDLQFPKWIYYTIVVLSFYLIAKIKSYKLYINSADVNKG